MLTIIEKDIVVIKKSELHFSDASTASSPCDVFTLAQEIFRKELIDKTKEHFVELVLDTKHRILAYHVVSIGILNSTLIHPREVFRLAIMEGGSSIIVCHNHPSFDVEPSPQDVEITNRLKESGELLGINLLDHIIIGDTYFSFKERGYL